MSATARSCFSIHSVAALLLFVIAFAAASTAWGDGARESPAQLVDDLHSAFGDHHVRAVHAKDIILEGSFTPSASTRGFD